MEGKKYFYLNPGLQNVRDFILDKVLEFLNKYKEVDGIHFDDWFYNNDIYSGDEQNIFKEFLKSNPNEVKSNWRREQVNILIDSLHNNIINFNKKIFSSSDPINWIIEEAHKRGIEFHALMNPVRINSNIKSIYEIIS